MHTEAPVTAPGSKTAPDSDKTDGLESLDSRHGANLLPVLCKTQLEVPIHGRRRAVL